MCILDIGGVYQFKRNILVFLLVYTESDTSYMIRPKAILVATAIMASGSLLLTGCSSGFTEDQQSMADAGPYVDSGSDYALKACSKMKQADEQLADSGTYLSTAEGVQEFSEIVFEAQQESYLADEQSLRYGEIYNTISGVDAAVLDINWEAVVILMEDAIAACKDMTVVDAEPLLDRDITITPGVIPKVN